MIGLDYQTFTPWETGKEIRAFVENMKSQYETIILIANSIGVFFCLNADIDSLIERAFFISPIVDMEKLIVSMMAAENITEDELRQRRVVRTSSGEDLSWEYLRYVRDHPVRWTAPTAVLCGRNDTLTSFETITAFADKCDAKVTVMENGGHWFHSEEQMRFLDEWIIKNRIEEGEK